MRIFGKWKCEFIAIRAKLVTSLPSLSLSLSLCISLSHRKYLTHNIGSASALPIIRSITSLSLAKTTLTPEHPFFSTHCYPSTSSDITCVPWGRLLPGYRTRVFPPEGLLLSGQGGCSRRPYQGKGLSPRLPLGQLDWQPVWSRAPKDPHLTV